MAKSDLQNLGFPIPDDSKGGAPGVFRDPPDGSESDPAIGSGDIVGAVPQGAGAAVPLHGAEGWGPAARRAALEARAEAGASTPPIRTDEVPTASAPVADPDPDQRPLRMRRRSESKSKLIERLAGIERELGRIADALQRT